MVELGNTMASKEVECISNDCFLVIIEKSRRHTDVLQLLVGTSLWEEHEFKSDWEQSDENEHKDSR